VKIYQPFLSAISPDQNCELPSLTQNHQIASIKAHENIRLLITGWSESGLILPRPCL
jgi:hypothetical protein